MTIIAGGPAPAKPSPGRLRRAGSGPTAHGAREMIPLLGAVAPFGLVVGASVAASDVDPVVGWSTAWTIYGGTAQLSAITLMDAGAPLLVLVATILVVNLRLLVYSAGLAPHWRGAPTWWRALACYLIVDPSYALGVRHAATDPAAHRAYYTGAGLILWAGWLLACGTGLVLGDRVTELLPADVVSELMLAALVAPALGDRGARRAVVVAAVVAIPACLLPLGTGSLAAGAVGVVVGLARREGR